MLLQSTIRFLCSNNQQYESHYPKLSHGLHFVDISQNKNHYIIVLLATSLANFGISTAA